MSRKTPKLVLDYERPRPSATPQEELQGDITAAWTWFCVSLAYLSYQGVSRGFASRHIIFPLVCVLLTLPNLAFCYWRRR